MPTTVGSIPIRRSSFADYHDPKRIHFGALRVLNDDTVAPGEGFGTHPHANMEIVSIPLSGALRHRDSMGHAQELRPGGIQVMSAGTGITHSEFNASDTEPVKFLQIWALPDARGHRPRYDQLTLAPAVRNELRPIVAPERFRERACGMDSPAGLVSYARPRCGDAGRIIACGSSATAFTCSCWRGASKRPERPCRGATGSGSAARGNLRIDAAADASVLLIEVPM